MEILVGRSGGKTKPIQSQTKPICRPSAGNPKHEIRNELNEGYLKKQSQFPKGKMNATVCYTRYYEN